MRQENRIKNAKKVETIFWNNAILRTENLRKGNRYAASRQHYHKGIVPE